MKEILKDFREEKSDVRYPAAVANNPAAKVFYGIVSDVFNKAEAGVAAEIALGIAEIIERHSKVDWSENKIVHDEISRDIDDLMYKYMDAGYGIGYEMIDEICERVKTAAIK